MSQHALTQAIHDKLLENQSDPSVHAMLQGRIHHLRGRDSVALPWLCFTLAQDEPQAYFDGSDDVEAQVTFDLYSDAQLGVAAAHDINDQLYTQLHRQAVAITGLAQGELVCMNRGVAELDGNAIRIRSSWRLWGSFA